MHQLCLGRSGYSYAGACREITIRSQPIKDVSSNAPRSQRGEEQSCCDELVCVAQPPLHVFKLPEAGREGGCHHRRRRRHRQGDRRRVHPEWRENHLGRRPGRPRPSGSRRSRPGRGLHPLRRHRRGAGRRGRRPCRRATRLPRYRLQQRRHHRVLRGLPHRVPRPGRLRPRDGGQPTWCGCGHQARGARHGPAPQRVHPLHRQHCGVARRVGPPRVQHLQDGGHRHGALGGVGAGELRRAGERHLPPRHPDADGDAVHERHATRGERRGAEADRGGGLQRDGRRGAAGGGHCEGGRVLGVRRRQVRERA